MAIAFRISKPHKGAGTRLIVYWHRFYDPSTGRYISADPIGLAGGMNLYAYVGGNPVNAIDPEGLMLVLVVPPDKGNRNVDPITGQIIDDWKEDAKRCPDCQHLEVDWSCVEETVDMLAAGGLKGETRVKVGAVTAIGSVIFPPIGAITTGWLGGISYGAILQCSKCVSDE